MHNNKNLLIPDGAGIMCLTDLAVAFGVNESLVLQQVYYLAHRTKFGRERDGQRWVFNTYAQWQEHCFPFWKESYVKSLFIKLEKQGALDSAQLHGRMSRVKSYAVANRVLQAFNHDSEAA